MMKKNLLKFSISSGRAHVAREDDELGWKDSISRVVEVSEVPEIEDLNSVSELLVKTNIPEWVNSVSYDQLGKNLFRADRMTDDQRRAAPEWFTKKFAS